MTRLPLAPLTLLILVLTFSACTIDGASGPERVVGAPTNQVEAPTVVVATPTDLTFVHENSCGQSFTGVNDAGTAQLSLSPARYDDNEDIESGLVELSDGTWRGVLEVGSGLRIWPCHDVANDFDEVKVAARWVATSGTIEIPQTLPATNATGGGGVREPFTIAVTDLVLTSENETMTIPQVTLSTKAWGFYGG